ncbi:MAG: molybdenum transporter, periplasmic molybdate-binding protein [Solirubrobacterales bacterium]|nr:molybdenum transporter, periplasmic molybdate-binding protein [Solirubrobacterales bacterium]
MTRPRRLGALLLTALSLTAATLVAGCGDDDESDAAGGGKGTLVVSAASSLKTAFTAYGDGFRGAKVRFSFAGSDMLAAQLRQGVTPDVFASANTTLPQELFAEGLVGKPAIFAGNRLVLAVPAGTTKVSGLDDLAADGITIAAGSESVPVGAYTRRVLGGLDDAQEQAILAHIRSSEPDVAGVVGKLTQGAVDAGFVYLTDVEATRGRLKAIELPSGLKPQVAYGVAIVKGAPHPEQAAQFVAGLRQGQGRQALLDAGFTAPPPP